MNYKIAIGSSDGKKIDLKFGEVEKFLVYEIDNLEYKLVEQREVKSQENKEANRIENCNKSECSSGGCSGNGHGCSGPDDIIDKVKTIEDCRCIVCKKVGFQAQKQFEKKAISVFDVECDISEALDKITKYYEKIDNKKPFKRH